MNEYPYYKIILFAWFLSAPIIFLFLIKITAPYGRHTRPGWGPMINNTLGWVIMEIPAVLVFSFFFLSGDAAISPVNWVFLGIWQLHYMHRSLIFPLRLPNKKKKMPLVIVVMGIFFNLINSYLNGFYLGIIEPVYKIEWLIDWRFITGIVIFILGFLVNIQSDSILFKMRKPGDEEYKIPYNGLFKWISCPNYFGEILEWAGWAIATWSLAGLSFSIWTAANLIPRALSNHKWCREKYLNYPSERKAVIPYIL